MGRACQSRESGCRPTAAFARSPSAPGGALLPTNSLSEGLWGHPRPSCLPLCPPGFHPGLSTSPFCQPGPLGCSGSGQEPAPRIPPALPLACGERAEERRGRELEWRRTGRKPLRHRDLKTPREAEAGGPGREQSSRAEAPPTRPRVKPSGRGGAVGASAVSFLLAPFTSRGLLSLSPVVHCRGTLDHRGQAQLLLHQLQLGTCQILCGGGGVTGEA